MASITEEANNYEPPKQTGNIADLDKVSTKLDIVEKTFKEGTEDEFKIKVCTVNGEDYRVPATVFAALKEILVIKPDLEYFKVTKTGEKLNTKYTVIPL